MSTAKPIENIKQHFSDSLFSRMVLASVGLHFAVVLSFTVRTFLFPSDAIDYQSAIRVDIVALPEKGQQIPKEIEETKTNPLPKPEVKHVEKPVEKPKEAIAEKPKVDLKAKKKEKKDALDKIKALQALESITDEVKESESKERLKKRDTQIKGNIPSKGDAISGIVSTQLRGYMGQLERHAKDHWTLPQWLADLRPQPKAKAAVFLDAKGFVIRRTIVESSGNSTFDDLILAAIDQASPFPAPPERFVDLVKVNGIQLNFPD
jgi:colicin import membrane protein